MFIAHWYLYWSINITDARIHYRIMSDFRSSCNRFLASSTLLSCELMSCSDIRGIWTSGCEKLIVMIGLVSICFFVDCCPTIGASELGN